MNRNSPHLFALALTCSLLGACPAAWAQVQAPAPINTDRPGFLFSPFVVPRERFQVEAGLPTFTYADGGGAETRAWSSPIALRYGLTDELELRASLPSWNDVRVKSGGGTDTGTGFGDLEIGAKLALSSAPESPLAVLASVRLPTGEDDFSAGSPGVSAFLTTGRDLGDSWWLCVCGGALYTPVDDGEDVTQGLLGSLVSHPLAPGWSAYGEATVLPGLHNAAGQGYLGAGLAWNPAWNVQLDLSADFGLDADAADVIAALGLSYCW